MAILFLALLLCPARVFGATAPGSASLTLAWNPNPETDITGYQLSYGTSTGSHPNILNAGASTSAAVTGLVEGTTYYFVVAATNQSGLQSQSSAEIVYQIPVTQTGAVTVIPQAGWSLHYVDSQAVNGYAATNAFDGNPNTMWATDYLNAATQPPHEIQIDMGAVYPVGGFRYLPRQDAYSVGNIGQYEFYVSMDGTQWGTPVAGGSFVDSKTEKEVLFSSVNGRYVRLRVLTEVTGDPNCAVAELNVLQGAAVVTPVNHAPVAASQALTTAQATPLALVLAASDADGNPLTYAVVTPPAHGTLSGTAPNLTYAPASNYSGTDSFTFKANDGTIDSAAATVSIAVTSLSQTGSGTVIPRSGWSLRYVNSQAVNGYAATNAFDGNPNTMWATDYLNAATQPPHEIQIDMGAVYPVGGFRYLPRQDAYSVGNIGQYEFYVSMDGTQWGASVASGSFVDSKTEQEVLFSSVNGRYVRLRILTEVSGDPNCAVAELNVLQGAPVVAPVNHAPVATSQALTTAQATPLALVLAASDADGNALTYALVTPPAHGTLSGTAPNLTYAPASNCSGADSFTFKANDGMIDSAAATVSITVTPGNHAPVFTLNPILGANASEGIAYTGQSLAGQATDADAGDTLAYSKVSGPAWLTVAANGDLSGTPPTGSAGLNSFVLRATDHASATGDTELRITVTGLPLPWVTTEVGTGQLAGSTVYATGTFTQAGSGKFGGTSDNFRFTYQTLSGDGEISAQVSSLQNTGTASRVGVMIRDSLAANAMQVFIGMTGSNSYVWARRTTTGGNNSTNNSNTGTVPNTWVRLVRSGNTLTAYKSTNGTSWTSVGKTTVMMAANCYIGLVVASGSNTTLNTSQMSNLHVTP